MCGLRDSICRYFARIAFRAGSSILTSLRPPLLVMLLLATLFLAAYALSAHSSQASFDNPATTAANVKAIHAGSGCTTPDPGATIAYDDGLFNFGLVAAPLTVIVANRFCVDSPAVISSARLYLVGPILRPIRVHVLDSGFRSTFSLDIDPQFESWLDVDFASANVSVDGDFYIGLQWLELFDGTFPRPYLGVDTTDPQHDMSFLGTDGSRQSQPRTGEDFMIRVSAIAEGPTPTPTPTPLPDADGDGVPDASDNCPNTPPGETIDANGCSPSQLDGDGDGVSNASDLCPNTPPGETVDANGCSASQLDDDGDGVVNALDNCPAWPNTDQSLPPWPVPVDDPDCDAFATDDENSIGTDPLVECGPGAWPPDTLEDHLVDSQDLVALLPGLFKSVGQDGYSARLDIFQPGNVIDSQDLVAMLPYLFKGCQPRP